MYILKALLKIFVYIVVLCPFTDVFSETRGSPDNFYRAHGPSQDHYHPVNTKPCEVCPRHGKCVPKVQCPAHVRPRSYNPLCHIEGQRGLVGVCCFTGSRHAAESDTRPRASDISSEDMIQAHTISKQKLDKWLEKAQRLALHPDATVNDTAPSFAHHLSVMNDDPNNEKLAQGGLTNLFTVQELRARDALSDEEILLGFTQHTDGPFCPPQPPCPSPPSRYRTIGGECNNPAEANLGATHTGYQRLLPPSFSDGLWSMRSSVSGLPLPGPREVSKTMLLPSSIPNPTHNLMFMQFGQFIVHDLTAAAVFNHANGSAISCCIGDGQDYQPPELQHWACAPIPIPSEDEFFKPFAHRCHNFVRAQLAPSSDCSVGYANPMNGVTHFIDLSHIYGSNIKRMSRLRSSEGLLDTFNDFGRELPPLTDRKECMTVESGAACFESGDNHGNQVISLTILHTIWTREHNRVARTLARLNPGWNEDRIFFETRRILQAIAQHIVYNEWLPMLLGPQLIQAFNLSPSPGYSSSYDPHANPSIAAEFSSAAMRFGHSSVDGKLLVPTADSDDGVYETISLPEVMFQPSRLRLRPFLDRLITGLTLQPMQNIDPFVSESLTRYLFHGGNPYGLDLAAINIQRGRDFGIRPYNDYRKLCGLEPFGDFGQFPTSITGIVILSSNDVIVKANQISPNSMGPPFTISHFTRYTYEGYRERRIRAAQRLSSVYQSPEDIDLWIGGLLEEPSGGSIVGATFANIIADQFARSKAGDRYFYEHGPDVNPGAFTPSQLVEIKKASLARLFCDNRDGYELLKVAPNAFLRSDLSGNEPVPCDSPLIPVVDLNRFREI